MAGYEKVKAWRARNKDKVNEQARRYREKHPETNKKAKTVYRMKHRDRILPKEAENARNRRKADPDGYRRRYLQWRERKEQKLTLEAGRPRPSICEICKEDRFPIVFDHCHSSEKFRGWICDQCNKVLGLVYDNPEILRKLAIYLEDFNGKVNSQ